MFIEALTSYLCLLIHIPKISSEEAAQRLKK